MGWWAGRTKDEIWGDEPADVMGEALVKIIEIFKRDWHRPPTLNELMEGLRFSVPEL